MVQKDPQVPVDRYSSKAADHFSNPRNLGRLEDYDGIGRLGDPGCGDYVEITVILDEAKSIRDVGFVVSACEAAVACGSILTEMVKGEDLRKSVRITEQDIIDALNGLPEGKEHCASLAINALHLALADSLQMRRMLQQGDVRDREEYRRLQEQGKIRLTDAQGDEDKSAQA